MPKSTRVNRRNERKPAGREFKGAGDAIDSAFESVSRLLARRAGHAPQLFPYGINKIQLEIRLPGSTGATILVEGPASGPKAASFAEELHQFHICGQDFVTSFAIDDLDLAPNTRAAAADLQGQFPTAVVFTSGRRTIQAQASAMASNIVRAGRTWIQDTYAASAARDQLQSWVDNNPQAVSQSDIAAGLQGIMVGWDAATLKQISFHLSGAAFDVQVVAGDTGSAVKTAIRGLANLNRFLENEGGLVIWHAQFDE